MVNFLNLPTVQAPRNAIVDLSGIGNAIDGNRRNALAMLDSKRQDEELAMRRENQTYQRGRDEKIDARQQVEWFGKTAAAIDRITDPTQRAAAWQNALKRHPDSAGLTPDYLDPMNGPKMVMAEAGQWRDPRDDRMKDLEIQKTQAQINQLNQRADSGGDFSKRATAAQTLGIDPQSDAYKSYVLTGRLPREDQQSLTATDKKAILEADDMVGSNRSAIQAIDEASRLNPKANSGWFAGARAAIGANLPDSLVPDFVSSPESSAATIDFDNAVVGQALSSLKSIFGGNPTEGERKILLDLQGSSGKPQAVRAEILARARRAAVSRMSLNEQRAQELRGGDFYKPGGGAAAANPMTFNSAAGDPLSEARAAIAKGADPAKVMERLQQMGVDPKGLQ